MKSTMKQKRRENKPKNSCAHVMPTEIFSRGHDFYKNDDKLDYSDGDI